jgi:hypothetical protein
MNRWIFLFSFIVASFSTTLAAKDAVSVDVQDAGFEAAASKKGPWRFSQHAGVNAYEISRDTEVFSEGKQSLKIRRTTPQVYGSAKQAIAAPQPGKYRYTAKLKTKGVDGRGWSIYVRVYRATGSWDSFFSDTLTGDVDWRDAEIKFVAPNDVSSIELGITLRGDGTGWADAVRLERLNAE